MADFLYRGHFPQESIGFVYAAIPDLCSEAVVRHACDPVAAHILSRALTATVLAAAGLNEHERLNAHWAYRGQLRTVLVDAGPDGTARGLISPNQLADAETVNDLFGEKAHLTLVRSADGQVRSSGTSDAPFQDVVEDMAYALCLSDQQESAMLAMVAFTQDPKNPVRVARGLLIQALPEANLTEFEQWRKNLQDPAVRNLMARLTEPDNLFEDVLHLVAPHAGRNNIHLSESIKPRFVCACSEEKMGAVLRTLSAQDRREIQEEGRDVVVTCNFCNRQFSIPLSDPRLDPGNSL